MRDIAQVGLHPQQKGGLLCIHFIEIDRTDHHIAVHYRAGTRAFKAAIPKGKVSTVISFEGPNHLLKQGIAIGRFRLWYPPALSSSRWVLSYKINPEGSVTSTRVSPISPSTSITWRTLSAVRVSCSARAEEITDTCPWSAVALERKYRVLGDQHRIGIQQNEYRTDQDNIGQGILHLNRLKKVEFPPPLRHRAHLLSSVFPHHSLTETAEPSDSSPHPIWYEYTPGWRDPAPASPADGGCGHPPCGNPPRIHSPKPRSAGFPGCTPVPGLRISSSIRSNSLAVSSTGVSSRQAERSIRVQSNMPLRSAGCPPPSAGRRPLGGAWPGCGP